MTRIGPYELRNPYILAPMAGVSEMPFRCLALRLGAALAPTELVSAAGLMRASARTMKYLRHDPVLESPFQVQIFGGDPAEMAEAAAVAKDAGAGLIDINMGCPVPKVTKNGAGSAMMCDVGRAARVLEAIAVRTGLPVTVKLRAGWDARTVNAPEVARELALAGAAAVAIHPRTRAQGYSGRADWSLIARVRDAVPPGCPVIGNGDVKNRDDAERMLRETACDAVMIGRAALGNPWLFREVQGGPAPTLAERRALILEHFDTHLQHGGGGTGAVRNFRRMLAWYVHGLRGASAFRASVLLMDEPAVVRGALDDFFTRAVASPGQGAPGEAADEEPIDYRQAYG